MEDIVPLWKDWNTKRCTGCGKIKGINDFYPNRNKCKVCVCDKVNKQRRPERNANYAQRKEESIQLAEIGMRRCRSCKAIKSLNEFPTRKDAKTYTCRLCRQENFRHNNLARIAEYDPSAIDHLGVKKCTKCHQVKPVTSFYIRKSHSSGYSPWCKICTLDDVSLQALKRHGLNREQYWAMFEAQGGGCAICKEPPPSRRKTLCIDHNHTTGEVRSLLCSTCNSAFGLLKENPERIRAMLAYAEKWQVQEKVG